MANMKQIARLAGVSLGTVSHVLNGSAKVSETLRRKVLEAVQSLGYEPSQLARGLRTEKTNIVGMIIPDITNPFFPAVVRGAEDEAFRSGMRLVLCNADNSYDKEVDYVRQLRTYKPTGLLIIPSSDSELSISLGSGAAETPATVFLDRIPARWKGDAVTVANEKGAQAAAVYLLSHRHRRIATITGPHALPVVQERLNGFRKVLRAAQIPLPDEYIQQSSFDRTSGYLAAKELLGLAKRPTAIFAHADMMAIGALKALREAGLRCPEDMSIIGFDGLELSEFTEPVLASIVQPGYQLGAAGMRLLLDRVEDPSSASHRRELNTTLREGASVGAPPVERTPSRKPSRRRSTTDA